jgi:hypothetical protein
MSDSSKKTKVQLSLYAQRLPNVAGAFKGKSDPYAIVTELSGDPRNKPTVLGKTETIKNSLSPRWTTTFLLDYDFGKSTRINVGIYDEIRKATINKPMGSAVFEIGDILGSRGGIKAKKLKNGGTLFARVEKAPEHHAGTFHVTLRGIKLKNVEGFLGRSDPFFEISRIINAAGGPSWLPVYRSEHVNNDLNPKWEPVSVDVNKLCEGDLDKAILIQVWDWDKSGNHTPMGSIETTVNAMIRAVTPGAGGNPKHVDTKNAFTLKRNGKDFGLILVIAASVSGGSNGRSGAVSSDTPFSMALGAPPSATVAATATTVPAPMATLPRPSQPVATPMAPMPMPIPPPPRAYAPVTPRKPKFIDYISGGLELQMAVAIDFTGSNGDPRLPGTLHYIHQDGQLNDYEKALSAVGSIVAKYDSDQKFPVLGFGAKYNGVIQHCFQVGRIPQVAGISGILEAYRETFRSGLTMSGPTLFAEVINLTAAQARSAQEAAKRIGQQSYTILLILTDGAVSDVHGTKQAIAAASDAPLSIVIVGIGNADFSTMQFLDDFQTQEHIGRDICQFVEFNRHKSNKMSLTQATLDEIPDQVVDYFYSRGIKPLPAITGSKVNVFEESFNEDQDIDLSLDYNSEGEICLADNEGYFDDTSYGTYSTYAGLTVMPPPTAPPANLHQASAPSPYVPSQGSPPRQNYPVQQAQVPAAPVFHVQVPQGVSPGMQLQLQHPSTKQNMIVTVPAGVAPGGTFAVRY